jgi:hypothetical protein
MRDFKYIGPAYRLTICHPAKRPHPPQRCHPERDKNACHPERDKKMLVILSATKMLVILSGTKNACHPERDKNACHPERSRAQRDAVEGPAVVLRGSSTERFATIVVVLKARNEA